MPVQEIERLVLMGEGGIRKITLLAHQLAVLLDNGRKRRGIILTGCKVFGTKMPDNLRMILEDYQGNLKGWFYGSYRNKWSNKKL